MSKRGVALGLLSIAGMGVAGLALRTTRAALAAETPVAPRQGDVPVVVELFTSEGCSSCPPADEVLARVASTQPIPGAWIFPLAFHVDYWDELGWPDPFASSAFTARQRAYAVDGRMYTPQAVVDGRTELVGSQRSRLEHAVAEAVHEQHAAVELSVSADGQRLRVSVHVGALPRSSDEPRASVFVAVTELEATVAVPRGENAGKTLRHTDVVRTFADAGTVPASGGDVSVALAVPSGVSRAALRVVAFVQRARDHAIVGAATATAPAR